jgi:hypothetical protein
MPLKTIFFSTGFLCLLFFVTQASEPIATLSSSYGHITVQRDTSKKWTYLPVGDSVFEGDRLRTEDNAKAELRFQDGSKIIISQNSDIQLISTSQNKAAKKKTTIFILFGSIWNSIVKGSQFEIESTHALAIIKGGECNVSVDDSMDLWLQEGIASISNEHATVQAIIHKLVQVNQYSAPTFKSLRLDQIPKKPQLKTANKFDYSYDSQLFQKKWHSVVLTLKNNKNETVALNNPQPIHIKADDGLWISFDKLNKHKELDSELNSDTLKFYVFSEKLNGNLSVFSNTIANYSETLSFKPNKQQDSVFFQFIDQKGITRQIQANFKKK